MLKDSIEGNDGQIWIFEIEDKQYKGDKDSRFGKKMNFNVIHAS